MADTKQKSPNTRAITTLLSVLGLLGILQTWGRSAADGTLIHLFNALHRADEYILPGTKDALRRRFTGIYWPVDYLLDILVIFFWEAVDGSHPATSLIGIYFLGQLFPIIVGFYMDSFRGQGFASNLIITTIWLLSFQIAALASTGWVWALVYIASSPTTSISLSRNALQSASLISPQLTVLIPSAVVLGYMTPAILMALPSPGIVTNNFQQLAVVAWNVYPLLVFVIFQILFVLTRVFSRQKINQTATSPQEHLRVVRWVNLISIALSSIIHISVCAVSISTVLFPKLFDSKYAHELNPISLVLPQISLNRGNTVGDGVRSFMMWDQVFGYAVVLLVMLVQLRTAIIARGGEISWITSIGAFVLFSCFAGPGSTCLAISSLRDETLFGYDETNAKQKDRKIRP